MGGSSMIMMNADREQAVDPLLYYVRSLFSSFPKVFLLDNYVYQEFVVSA